MFSKDDEKFMRLALKEAEKGYKKGDYPVGAVLVVDGKVIGIGNNSLKSGNKSINHAEMNIITKYSDLLTKSRKAGKKITLYTTLEPCLMCFGTSVLHRIDRIVYAAKDPDGGATNLFRKNLKGYYARHWPIIEGGLFEKEARELIIKFLKLQTNKGWKAVLKTFLDVK